MNPLSYKSLFYISLTLLLALVLFLTGKRYYYSSGMSKQNFATNYQYTEQTNIFQAYNSPCDIAFIGDSHIYKCHWGELLNVPVCNRGVGSDVTKGVYNRIGDIIKACPKICFILCGVNDIERGVSVEEILKWYQKIIDTLTNSRIKAVIMQETAVADHYPDSDKINGRLLELNEHLRKLAPCISITITEGDWQPDGIHLTAQAYLKWAEAIKKML